MSRQWHWLAATLLLITTAACSRPGTEEPDCPTKITLPPGATPTTTLDPRCIVRATTTGTADGDAASRWTGTVRIAGFYASICNAIWDGNVSLAGKDELTGKATLILVETSCPGKVVAGELVLKGNVGSDSLAITWAHPELPQRAFDLGAGQGTIRRSGDRAEGTFNSDMGGGTEFFLTWSLTMRN